VAASDDVDRVWWKEAVVYEVFPRSFNDGDGLGDIPGLVERLDCLDDLGVDVVWTTPVYDTPAADLGYDVRDYRAIAREMGDMADRERLAALADVGTIGHARVSIRRVVCSAVAPTASARRHPYDVSPPCFRYQTRSPTGESSPSISSRLTNRSRMASVTTSSSVPPSSDATVTWQWPCRSPIDSMVPTDHRSRWWIGSWA
jgi:hypothetical protein